MGMVPSIIDVFIIGIEHQLLKLDTNGPDGISASILRNWKSIYTTFILP